jgi:hypothetical protein
MSISLADLKAANDKLAEDMKSVGIEPITELPGKECSRCKTWLPGTLLGDICDRCEKKEMDRQDYVADVLNDYLDLKGR